MSTGENEIFKKLQEGDEKAFEYFFKKYYQLLFNYAFQIVRDQYIAEEIVEDTYLIIWEKRKEIALKGSFLSYLLKSVYNQCLNHLKHQKVEDKYRSFFMHHMPSQEITDSSNSYPLSTLAEKEFEEKLELSIGKLPEQCRRIFILSRFENKRNQEIAEMLDISVNTVKTQLMRALGRIRKDLRQFIATFF
ncbi:RNA polymerase sigma-70 factor [Gaoshiqia sediminis]|uniref:RNA polymerase sigma-70 factor n=1 Tax=Gaoshiqia sediminis TaxID=2986998 RepID=A0AA42C832_9BACT|nr:RNA polymerase sigma-70 factor [Gaoshiqia sediminis]MCW0484219.1 RNA polymerase sigma-70 factor [Gaoshiqia sediminis]